MVTERRQSPRCKPFGLVYLNLASDNGGIVIDASEDGLQFQAVAPVEHDDGPMPVWFTLNPANRIETVGEVVWTDETKKTGGLRFTNLEGESRLQIRKWLELNGSPLPVRVYTSPIDLALSESSVLEEPEHQQQTAPIRKPRAAEIEEVLNRVESENMPSAMSTPTPTLVPRYPRIPLYPDPRPEIKDSEPPAISILEAAHPVEPTPVIPLRVPRGSEPGSTVNTREATSEPPATFIREMIHPAESAPVIPQRVPPPPFSTIKEEPVASRSLSHETAAPAPIYSGYESEEVLREVASAAKHRLDDDPPVQYYNQSFGNFPAPISYPSVPERAPQDQSRAGISVRTSDYATPWRSTFASGPSAIRRERVSLLAGLLYRAGVPSDIVRDVEIMIVVFGLVVATGVALIIFHRQVGEGVQWVGQNVMSKNTELVEKPVGTDRLPPPDSTLSPLLQPPPGTQAPPVVEKRKPKPVVEAGGMQRPTIYAADPNAPSLVPPLPDDTGEAELASALQYLRADSGSTETNVGVKWLWASVEKGNTKAAIILADLYVWGRGVPQNCDQARVLLTAAAKRASVEAAQRLQDMEADGCVSGAKTPSH